MIGGDQDGPDFPERAKHRIADSIPNGNATLTLLPGLGHVTRTCKLRDIFYPALLKFLKSDAQVSGAAR